MKRIILEPYEEADLKDDLKIPISLTNWIEIMAIRDGFVMARYKDGIPVVWSVKLCLEKINKVNSVIGQK